VSRRRVVVTGRGVVSPLGAGVDAHWRALVEGRRAVRSLEALAGLGLGPSRGGQVGSDVLEPLAGRLPRKQQKLYNRPTLFAMLAASLAVEEAGGPAAPAERRGVLLGVNALSWELAGMTAYVGAAESPARPGVLDMALANAYCMRSINPLDYSLKTLPNLAAGHLAIAHDAQGACRAMTDGPVGGLEAVGQALRMIEEGDLDVALAGATEALLDPFTVATYHGAGVLAADDGRPGLELGEGAAVLVLEDEGGARARGAAVHGTVLGFAQAAGEGVVDAGAGVARFADRVAGVLEAVLDEAGGAPDVVAFHAMGLPAHDAAEAEAVARLARGWGVAPAAVRFPRALGDLGAAGGVAALLGCSAVLGHGMIPPVVLDGPIPPRPWRTALVIALGVFGECAAVMLGREPGRP
jgi:3-oxoacyl-(acyl-carrier-protein) synthase